MTRQEVWALIKRLDDIRKAHSLESIMTPDERKTLSEEEESICECLEPLINSLPPGRGKVVARTRIIDGYDCGWIARTLHYSRSCIYKSLGDAIKSMSRGDE